MCTLVCRVDNKPYWFRRQASVPLAWAVDGRSCAFGEILSNVDIRSQNWFQQALARRAASAGAHVNDKTHGILSQRAAESIGKTRAKRRGKATKVEGFVATTGAPVDPSKRAKKVQTQKGERLTHISDVNDENAARQKLSEKRAISNWQLAISRRQD